MIHLGRIIIARSTARHVLSKNKAGVTSVNSMKLCFFSDGPTNITYSGGQASEGQGGYYGSGGARVLQDSSSLDHRPEMLALSSNIQKVQHTMKEVDTLEALLRREQDESDGKVSGKIIEIKSSIKKLMTAPDFIKSLNDLEVKGEPT